MKKHHLKIELLPISHTIQSQIWSSQMFLNASKGEGIPSVGKWICPCPTNVIQLMVMLILKVNVTFPFIFQFHPFI